MPLRIAVLASGRGSNMESLLQAIEDGLVDGRITMLVTDRPDAPCLAKAQAADVPVLLELPKLRNELREDYDVRLVEALQREDPDLIILAGFMRILGSAFCAAFAGRIINIHPALLPACKGAHGIRDALRAGVKIAGCSTHFVTDDLDGGPIIMQAALAVHEGEDEESLAARVLRLEHQILPRTVQLIAQERVRIVDGRVRIEGGPSWHGRVEAVPGALYSEGF